MTRILVVEDHSVVRKGIINVLEQWADLQVIGQADDGVAAMQLLQGGLMPDVVLTDLNMPRMNGLELIQQITDLKINVASVMLTMHTDIAFLIKAQAAGAKGYLLKNGDVDEMVNCIRNVHKGILFVGKEFEQSLPDENQVSSL